MRGSRQITNDMAWHIIGHHFAYKNIVTYNNPNAFQEMDDINELYNTIREYTIEVNGYTWNFHSHYEDEDKAILRREYLNKCDCGSFRNFKVCGLYTIWERI